MINYISGIEYKPDGTTIDIIHTEEGIARNSSGTYSYEYNLSVHLGNVRATFYKNPNTNQLEVLQRDDYYAFGLRKVATGGTNKYLYNGKELQEERGQYNYGARFYDPVIGRWYVADPLAENYQHWSPYNYATNNPISIIDPDGRSTQAITTRYVDPNGNTILNTNDGRDDVFMVPWNRVAEFSKNSYWASRSNTGQSDSQGWNDYWRSEFKQVLSESTVYQAGYKALHSEEARAAQVKFLITGDFSEDFYNFIVTERSAQWHDPVFVAGNVLGGLHGFVSLFKLSIKEVMENPNVLRGKSPAEVEAALGNTEGLRVEKLGKGSQKGNGFVLREYNERGQPTGRQLRWHPGGGHHGIGSYWRVVGRNGDLGGVIKR